jgi:hypothetical protein
MGTRNLTIVRDENLLFGQYGQWDGYPEGNGVGVLTFLKRQMAFQQFRQAVKRIVVASQERLEELARADIDKDTHPQFFRGLGTGILDFIADGTGPVEVHNQIDFAADSLFCEWAYMVDLVERKLRCFKGFNKSPLTESDFFYFLSDKSRGGYYPIREIASFSFDDLPEPDVFVKTLCPPDEE